MINWLDQLTRVTSSWPINWLESHPVSWNNLGLLRLRILFWCIFLSCFCWIWWLLGHYATRRHHSLPNNGDQSLFCAREQASRDGVVSASRSLGMTTEWSEAMQQLIAVPPPVLSLRGELALLIANQLFLHYVILYLELTSFVGCDDP